MITQEYQIPMDKAILVHRGCSWRDKNEYVMRSALPITAAIAYKSQRELGFDPDGYGFYNFDLKQILENLYEARWVSSGSCD